ncbi:lytic transglycosylase domain-containing protein [Aurantiacibacter xanthus]|uniref:Lytic transglycosylase domain-containing protein n=1 Tax=Aurantiacibacter xanthus TaxID=1784712 RepID=A0A3A1P6M9_9SPHN|nr:lytic transglycosylase domain-containing protein [Aurantiacibacter xanthus]RIV88145.1 lytic transglycosylase domain-containing protein [Aurantiacibacter xanthus]
MILRALTLSATALVIAVGAAPAHADVLEVGAAGEARWVAGPAMAVAASQDLSASYAMVPAPVQVPAEISALVPESAVADPALHDDDVPLAYAAKVAELAARFDLSPALIEALVWQESRWRANARSPVGAQGLAQLMPGTARYLGVDAGDPFANLEGGARYLREQLDRFDGNLEKALAAYNAGPGRVMRAGGIPRIRETQQYVAAIMGRLANHSRSSE